METVVSQDAHLCQLRFTPMKAYYVFFSPTPQ